MPMTATMKNSTPWDMWVVKYLLQNSQDKPCWWSLFSAITINPDMKFFYQHHPMKVFYAETGEFSGSFLCLPIRKTLLLEQLTSDCVSVFTCLSHRTPRKKSSPPENCLPTQTFKVTSESSTWKPVKSNYTQLKNSWGGCFVVTLERSSQGIIIAHR